MTKFTSVDDYINAQTPDAAERLLEIRKLFHKVFPQTQLTMVYMQRFADKYSKLYL